MGKSHETAFSLTFQRNFNVSLLRAHYDTKFTERAKMIKACGVLGARKPNFNVNCTAKMKFIVQSWIVQVTRVFSPR